MSSPIRYLSFFAHSAAVLHGSQRFKIYRSERIKTPADTSATITRRLMEIFLLIPAPAYGILLLPYLLGSIPFGYILVRAFRGDDIRQSGSGNIGATNVARSSPALGALTLLLDSLKGLAAVALTRAMFPGDDVLAAAAALAAILGHMFPVWLRFRGGKGVATSLGSFALLTPKSILIILGIFLAVVAASRYISLGSIIAAAALPFIAWMLGETRGNVLMAAFLVAASALVIAKHHENIRRLLAGMENRFHWRRP
jgi:acyl phosphate:glycerol-3-phosphate acyltransferase